MIVFIKTSVQQIVYKYSVEPAVNVILYILHWCTQAGLWEVKYIKTGTCFMKVLHLLCSSIVPVSF